MNLLLDTHSFLWSAFSPGKLSRKARAAIVDPESDVYVSAVSFWEISLKSALGKIELKDIAPEDLPGAAEQM
jgi:PIN domain nuclease of toxin-antitoxin system